jgi:hypothetical protein
MADQRKLSFDYAATLEELAGIGKNRRFDDIIDDGENDAIQVICRRGDEEIPLAKPSRAFYFGDRKLYDDEARRFDKETKDEILCTGQFPRNSQTFLELKKAVTTGFVIPFVGAGMSVSAGLPSWDRIPLATLSGCELRPGCDGRKAQDDRGLRRRDQRYPCADRACRLRARFRPRFRRAGID